MSEPTFAIHDDDRGRLVPIEFADLPFAPRRVFHVRGNEERRSRGDHAVPCDELVVLLTGSATFRTTGPDGERVTRLDVPGTALRLRPGDDVSYVLDGAESTVIVFASEPYTPHPEPR